MSPALVVHWRMYVFGNESCRLWPMAKHALRGHTHNEVRCELRRAIKRLVQKFLLSTNRIVFWRESDVDVPLNEILMVRVRIFCKIYLSSYEKLICSSATQRAFGSLPSMWFEFLSHCGAYHAAERRRICFEPSIRSSVLINASQLYSSLDEVICSNTSYAGQLCATAHPKDEDSYRMSNYSHASV